MAIRIKRAETGFFTPSEIDSSTSKTLVDRQLGYERATGKLKINDAGVIKDAIVVAEVDPATLQRITNLEDALESITIGIEII